MISSERATPFPVGVITRPPRELCELAAGVHDALARA
jgi:hypothetical protein